MTDTELTLEKLANMLASGLPNLDEAGFIKLVAAARNHIGAAAAELRVADASSASIDALVERFLAWPLPASVCCDLCVTKSTYRFPRSGTNLLTADEARQMIEHLLDGLPAASGPPANREDAGGVARDQPGGVNKLIEQEAFNRGLEAGAEYLNTLAGMPVGDATSALYRNLANEIRALKNTGETELAADGATCGGTVSQVSASPGEPQATGMGELQRLGQEFDAAPGLRETESVTTRVVKAAKRTERVIDSWSPAKRDFARRVSGSPSDQGDDAVEQRLRGLIDHWHNGRVDGNEVLATLHCSATALKTLKAERDKAVANTNKTLCAKSETDREIGRMTAERDSLSKKVERLTALLREANPFVGYSMHVPDIKAKIDAALAEEDG